MAGGELKALRDRLKAASGSDRELDARIEAWEAGRTFLEWHAPYYTSEEVAGSNGGDSSPVTASIDAALALCERKLPGWGFKCECNLGFGIEVTLGHVGPDKFYDRPQGFGTGPTLPLAILLALLEALIGKETG